VPVAVGGTVLVVGMYVRVARLVVVVDMGAGVTVVPVGVGPGVMVMVGV
jgi:hypothetical protein